MSRRPPAIYAVLAARLGMREISWDGRGVPVQILTRTPILAHSRLLRELGQEAFSRIEG